MSGQPAQQSELCARCRRRPAAYVLDRLSQLGQTLSGPQARAAFPVWACEDCVQHQLDQVLDVVSMTTVCRADNYRP